MEIEGIFCVHRWPRILVKSTSITRYNKSNNLKWNSLALTNNNTTSTDETNLLLQPHRLSCSCPGVCRSIPAAGARRCAASLSRSIRHVANWDVMSPLRRANIKQWCSAVCWPVSQISDNNLNVYINSLSRDYMIAVTFYVKLLTNISVLNIIYCV